MALQRMGLKADWLAAALTMCCVALLGMTSVGTEATAFLQQGSEAPAAELAAPQHPAWDGTALACPQLLIEALLLGCPISVDRLSLQFSRGSDAPLPADEVARLAAQLNANGMPVNRSGAWLQEAPAAHESLAWPVGRSRRQLRTVRRKPCCRCCSVVADVVAAGCGCTAAFAAELEAELQREGTTTQAFVQGALGVLTAACQIEAACPEDADAGR